MTPSSATYSNKWLKYYLPSYLYAIFIFVLSSISLEIPPLPLIEDWSDELLHLSEYIIFGWLLARSFKNAATPYFKRNFLFLAFIIGGLYAVSDEYHQIFVPNRGFELLDLLADFAGTFLGAVIYRYEIIQFRIRNQKSH